MLEKVKANYTEGDTNKVAKLASKVLIDVLNCWIINIDPEEYWSTKSVPTILKATGNTCYMSMDYFIQNVYPLDFTGCSNVQITKFANTELSQADKEFVLNNYIKKPNVTYSNDCITISNWSDTIPKENTMLEVNKDAVTNAAKLTAGKAINTLALAKIAPMLPEQMQPYADTAIAQVVLANILVVASNNYNIANLDEISKLMLDAAMLELMGSFNIEQLLSGFVSPEIMGLVPQ